MKESQNHGFLFEKQIKNFKIKDILHNLNISYTNKRDVQPISIKSFKFTSNTIEFGSIERIFDIKDDFILILIGYEQQNNIKNVIFSDSIYIKNEELDLLKGTLLIEEIQYLNNEIKKFKIGEHENARNWAKEQNLYDILKKELKIINKLNIDNINSGIRIRKQIKH